MSQNSSKQTYEAFKEWHNWAKTKYPSFNQKKKKSPVPIWSLYEN